MKIVADQKEHEVQYQQVPPQIIDRSAGWRFQPMLPRSYTLDPIGTWWKEIVVTVHVVIDCTCRKYAEFSSEEMTVKKCIEIPEM